MGKSKAPYKEHRQLFGVGAAAGSPSVGTGQDCLRLYPNTCRNDEPVVKARSLQQQTLSMKL